MTSSYREDCNRARDARQGVIDQKPGRTPGAKDKPVVVECRWAERTILRHKGDDRWYKFGAYRTREIAQKAIDDHKRKYRGGFYEFRFKGEA